VSGQLHASAALPPWQNPGTHWVGDWLSPGAGMDILEREKISFSYHDSNPDSPASMTVAAPIAHLWLMICRKRVKHCRLVWMQIQLFCWHHVDYTDTTIYYASEVKSYHGHMAPACSRFPELSCSPSVWNWICFSKLFHIRVLVNFCPVIWRLLIQLCVKYYIFTLPMF